MTVKKKILSNSTLELLQSQYADEFTWRISVDGLKAGQSAREETMSATEEIGRVESAIDERVKGLYGI